MKSKLLLISIIFCFIFNCSVFAIETQYTVKDILNVSELKVNAVSAEKNTALSKEYGDVYNESAREFVEKMLSADVYFFDSPREENVDKTIITFKSDDVTYVYNNYEGFYIYDGEEAVVLRYLISDENLDKLIDKMAVKWETTEADIPARFKIGSDVCYLKGKENQIDVAPYIDETTGYTMIPLRVLAETVGYSVEWNANKKTATLTNSGLYCNIKIGSNEINLSQYSLDSIYMDGIEVADLIWDKSFITDAVPCVVNDRTFIPLRTVAEVLNYNVEWNGETKEVFITNKLDTGFYPFPMVMLPEDKTSIGAGIKSYNTSLFPVCLGFRDGTQLLSYVRNMNGEKVLSIVPGGATLAHTQRYIYYGIPDELTRWRGINEDILKQGTYYCDSYFANDENTAFRIFFDVD